MVTDFPSFTSLSSFENRQSKWSPSPTRVGQSLSHLDLPPMTMCWPNSPGWPSRSPKRFNGSLIKYIYDSTTTFLRITAKRYLTAIYLILHYIEEPLTSRYQSCRSMGWCRMTLRHRNLDRNPTFHLLPIDCTFLPSYHSRMRDKSTWLDQHRSSSLGLQLGTLLIVSC